jgi:hypothetical protein
LRRRRRSRATRSGATAKDQPVAFSLDHQGGAFDRRISQHLFSQRAGKVGGDRSLQGPGTELWLVPLLQEQLDGLRGELQTDLPGFLKILLEVAKMNVGDPVKVFALQGPEHDDLIHAIEKLRAKMPPQSVLV